MMVQNQDKKKRKRKKLDAPNMKKKKNVETKGRDLADLDADEFMASIGNDSDGDTSPPAKPKPKKKNKKLKTAKSPANSSESPEQTENGKMKDENIPKCGNVKKGLSRLQENDTDFFKFLQENDPELLHFSAEEDSDDSESGKSDDELGAKEEDNVEAEDLNDEIDNQELATENDQDLEVEAAEEPVIKPPESTSIPVTSQLLKKWESNLQRNSLPTWKQLIRAFQAAVVTAKGDDTDSVMKYSIIDPDTVNRVIMMCIEHSAELLKHHLGNNPTSSTKWNKVKMSLKSYLTSLTDLLGLLTSNDVLSAVMRHCKAMLPYYAAYSRLIKKFVKAIIAVWGSKADLSRVVAFTCLQAVVQKIPTFLEDILKMMYIEYTKCSKMMNPKSRDNIILMRNCLVEMLKINPSITYTTGFLYIRQLAVTLRSVTVNKKEIESVYNWQFVNCLHVWVSVLSDCDACLHPLIFPLIQVMMGVVKLHSSPCFYPLHLHTIRMMLCLAAATDKHIPLIHPLLTTLEFCALINKSPATKPVDLTCVLRVTKGYKKTKEYQDGVFDLTYELLLNYTSQLSQSISFPEVSFPVTVWLKKFNKKCNNSKYTSQIKQVLEKIETVSRDLTERRSRVSFTPKDLDKVTEWEAELPESALTKYFNTWLRVHRTSLAARQVSDNTEEQENEDIEEEEEESSQSPQKKPKKKSKKKLESDDASKDSQLLESNSSSPDKKKKKKKKGKEKKKEVTTEEGEFVDNGDIVEDIVLSD